MVRTHTKKNLRNRTFSIIGVLLVVNTAVAHVLTTQIVTRSYAETIVKDASVVIPSEIDIVSESPAEATITIPVAEDKATISTYIVKEGDTLSSIAETHDISVNTIRWANSLGAKSTIRVGQKLTILPVTGVQYTIKKGDTISSIAKKFSADTEEILNSNDLEDASKIKIGMVLIIPDAAPLAVAPVKKSESKPKTVSSSKEATTKNTDNNTNSSSKEAISTKGFVTPIASGILTQGRHGTNGVDFGAPIGTAIYAAKDGVVILSKALGYNGGYGGYIVIDHGDGTQTLYAHLSGVSVEVGETVSAGAVIGKSGNTGRSTGPHLHFEVRGATNPFSSYKVGTRF